MPQSTVMRTVKVLRDQGLVIATARMNPVLGQPPSIYELTDLGTEVLRLADEAVREGRVGCRRTAGARHDDGSDRLIFNVSRTL